MKVSDAIERLNRVRCTFGDIEIEGLRDITTTQKQVKRIVGGIRVEYVIELKIANTPKQQWERQ